MKRFAAAAVALTVGTVSQAAWACPVCAQRQDGGAMGTIALATLVISPWFIALAIGLYIRRAARQEAAQFSSEAD
jgi:hypothetical protein